MVRRLEFIIGKSTKSGVYCDEHQAKLCEYNKELKRARHSFWEIFCKTFDSVNHTSKVKTFLSKTPIQAETLLNDVRNYEDN